MQPDQYVTQVRPGAVAPTNAGDCILKAVVVGVQYVVLLGDESGGQFHGD